MDIIEIKDCNWDHSNKRFQITDFYSVVWMVIWKMGLIQIPTVMSKNPQKFISSQGKSLF